MENNNTALVGLILAMIFLLVLPAMFFLLKQNNPPQIQPNLVVQPPVVAPVIPPVVPPAFPRDMYHRGWADAHSGYYPNPTFNHHYAYRQGYSDFCYQYRPGFHFEFRIR